MVGPEKMHPRMQSILQPWEPLALLKKHVHSRLRRNKVMHKIVELGIA